MEHALRFDLRAEVLPGPIRFDAEGCLTEANCLALLNVLNRALALQGCPRIIVNLSGLDHLDPGGLRALEDQVATQTHGHGRTPPAHGLLAPRPVVSIQAPPMPRHCSGPETGQDVRGIPLENAAADRGPAYGAFTRDCGPGLVPVVGPVVDRSVLDG